MPAGGGAAEGPQAIPVGGNNPIGGGRASTKARTSSNPQGQRIEGGHAVASGGLRRHGRILGAGSLIEGAAWPRESGREQQVARASGEGAAWGIFPPYIGFL